MIDLPVDYRQIPERMNIAGEVVDRFEERGYSNRTAFVWNSGEISYCEFSNRVNKLAHGLAEFGIKKGMPVLVRMHNCVEFAETVLALMKLGALPVLQNSLLSEEEVAYVIEHSEAQAAVTLASLSEPLLKLKKNLPTGIVFAKEQKCSPDNYEGLIRNAPSEIFVTADTASDDPAFFIYTSGTTGRPKCIVHAHRWVIALGDSNAWRVPPENGDRAYATGEWSFISALGHNVMFPLRNGVTGVILEGRATPENILATIQEHRVTLMYSVATVYRRILAMEGVENEYDLSSLRGCNATGEALEATTWQEFKDRIGCDIWEHYGVSEMQMVLGQGPRKPVVPGSIGIAIPGTEVAVLDDDYNEVADDQIGHFLIRSDNPGFFLGYHRDPEKTAEVLHNGWYHTGDLASRDKDGYYRIAGRNDDCFKSRGIFISPYEIENILRQHPAIAEACIVPMADPEIGNRIRAVCVLKDGTAATDEIAREIRQSVRSRMAPYKTPHFIEFIDVLPKSPVGKVLRRELIS
ncbi:MAG: Benzoate--CoA ligase [Alphaproteobacteria bacterium MarineAlpha11_Bin1]|nr:MAG: Benzoate--CoA ligase [Alphaproteobacteria bacterium MarineAlpha11_Bin1]|tara:strand:- start:7888 stop:9450 length:1563 start_codon:yes stop_codon:yes gene_type:complete